MNSTNNCSNNEENSFLESMLISTIISLPANHTLKKRFDNWDSLSQPERFEKIYTIINSADNRNFTNELLSELKSKTNQDLE